MGPHSKRHIVWSDCLISSIQWLLPQAYEVQKESPEYSSVFPLPFGRWWCQTGPKTWWYTSPSPGGLRGQYHACRLPEACECRTNNYTKCCPTCSLLRMHRETPVFRRFYSYTVGDNSGHAKQCCAGKYRQRPHRHCILIAVAWRPPVLCDIDLLHFESWTTKPITLLRYDTLLKTPSSHAIMNRTVSELNPFESKKERED